MIFSGIVYVFTMIAVVPLFPGVPGGIELIVILLIVVLLFGANKVPQLARASGQAMGEFKRGRENIERDISAATKPSASDAAVADAGIEADESADDERATEPTPN